MPATVGFNLQQPVPCINFDKLLKNGQWFVLKLRNILALLAKTSLPSALKTTANYTEQHKTTQKKTSRLNKEYLSALCENSSSLCVKNNHKVHRAAQSHANKTSRLNKKYLSALSENSSSLCVKNNHKVHRAAQSHANKTLRLNKKYLSALSESSSSSAEKKLQSTRSSNLLYSDIDH